MTHPIAAYVETNLSTPDQLAEFYASCEEYPYFTSGTPRWSPLPKPRAVTVDVEDLTAILDAIRALADVVAASSHRHDAQVAAGIVHHTVVSLSSKHDLPEGGAL